MIPFDTAAVFFAASLALALAPGPDNLFVLAQSALFGRKAGLLVTLGLCTGIVVHTLAVALGVAVIFATSSIAFNALKILGAGYLLYLALGAFRAGSAARNGDTATTLSPRALYLRGVVMNVTNPKVAIFFLAFLPQFADPARGSIAVQVVMLGGLFIVSALLVFGSLACFASTLGAWLKMTPGVQVWMNRVAGVVFVALAIRLALAER